MKVGGVGKDLRRTGTGVFLERVWDCRDNWTVTAATVESDERWDVDVELAMVAIACL
jgi:hypothetical protein